MSKFWLVGYRIKPGNRSAAAAWFVSDEGRDILQRMKSETQVSYVCTYLTIREDQSELSADDFDAYDLWEVPDLAALNRLPASPAYAEFELKFHALIIDKSWKVNFLERVNG